MNSGPLHPVATLAAARRAPAVAVAAAAAVSVAIQLHLLRDVGPANDEWTFLLYRPLSLHGVLDEYNGQPIISEILLYEAWAWLAGPGWRLPLLLAYAAMHVAVGGLVYAMARRRVGPWPAAGAAVLVLFLGRAWETLLTPASLTFMLPTLAACAAWAALDGPPRRARLAGAAALLGAAAVCGGLAPAILGGLAVELAVARRRRGWWLVAAGLAPLAAWYGIRAASTPIPQGAGRGDVDWAAGLGELPGWSLEFLAASGGAVLGLGPGPGAAALALAVLAAVVLHRGLPPLTPRAAGLLATLGATVVGTGLARAATTPPATSRYLYFPAVLLVLLACEAWGSAERGLPRRAAERGLPRRAAERGLPRGAIALGAALVAVAVALGVDELRDGKVFYRRAADGTAARMGALTQLGPRVPPTFAVTEPSRLAYTRADVERFVAAHGDEALHDPGELREALPESRHAADLTIAPALLHPASGPRHGCAPLRHAAAGGGGAAAASRGAPIPVRTPIVAVTARRATIVRLRALGPPPGAVALPLAAGVTIAVDTARLRPGLPWRIAVAAAAVRACRS